MPGCFYYPTVLYGLIKKEQRGADESRDVTKAVGEKQLVDEFFTLDGAAVC